ncbi:MAG: hypothetical protein ACRYGM_06825 [Janthinobacterium lividum]
MRLILLPVIAGALLSGCGLSSGIVPVAPGIYALSEMRAPVRGGGAEAQRAVLVGAAGFCRQQGRRLMVIDLQPGGDPRIRDWPTAFDLTFQCG